MLKIVLADIKLIATFSNDIIPKSLKLIPTKSAVFQNRKNLYLLIIVTLRYISMSFIEIVSRNNHSVSYLHYIITLALYHWIFVKGSGHTHFIHELCHKWKFSIIAL